MYKNVITTAWARAWKLDWPDLRRKFCKIFSRCKISKILSVKFAFDWFNDLNSIAIWPIFPGKLSFRWSFRQISSPNLLKISKLHPCIDFGASRTAFCRESPAFMDRKMFSKNKIRFSRNTLCSRVSAIWSKQKLAININDEIESWMIGKFLQKAKETTKKMVKLKRSECKYFAESLNFETIRRKFRSTTTKTIIEYKFAINITPTPAKNMESKKWDKNFLLTNLVGLLRLKSKEDILVITTITKASVGGAHGKEESCKKSY